MMLPLRLAQPFLIATALLGLCVGAWSGCGSTDTESSPSPVPGSLEPYEDWRWEAWLHYEDSTVELHVLTYFDLFEAKDGLFCGRYVGYWGYPGAYLAVYDGTQWLVIVDVQPGDYQGWGLQGRTYGTVAMDLALSGWLDVTSQSDVDALDPAATPEPVPSEQYFRAWFLDETFLWLDIFPITLGELIEDATRDGADPFSGTTATLPMDLPLDFAPYALEHTGPVKDDAVAVEAQFCTWAKESVEESTRASSRSSTGRRTSEPVP